MGKRDNENAQLQLSLIAAAIVAKQPKQLAMLHDLFNSYLKGEQDKRDGDGRSEGLKHIVHTPREAAISLKITKRGAHTKWGQASRAHSVNEATT